MKKSLVFSFSLIGEIGFATAIPLVGASFLGSFLDKKYYTNNLFLIICILLANFMIYFYIRKIIIKATKQFSKLNEH